MRRGARGDAHRSGWPHQDRSTSALNDATRQAFTQYLKEQVGGDQELFAKLVPDYVCLGKRTLQDNGSWLAALRRDDVDLVTDPIAEIREDRIVCESGAEIPVDVIVYATGFHANRFLWPMEITGKGGVKLAEQWGDEPSAHLGITVPGFPNLFCIYGPGTNLAHGGSLIFHAECQVRYILGCLKVLLEGGFEAIECRPEVHDAYEAKHADALSRMVWSHPSIQSSWYRNREGRVTVLSPWGSSTTGAGPRSPSSRTSASRERAGAQGRFGKPSSPSLRAMSWPALAGWTSRSISRIVPLASM
jgi:4-hydroxyacetophenone monooxygenase